MAVEVKVPEVGESVSEVEIGEWLKSKGDFVKQDEPLVELESEKATVELPSPIAGRITEVLKKTGDTAEVGETIGYMEEGEALDKGEEEAKGDEKQAQDEPAEKEQEEAKAEKQPSAGGKQTTETAEPEPAKAEQEQPAAQATPQATQGGDDGRGETPEGRETAAAEARVMPAAQRLMAHEQVRPEDVEPTGPGGRVLKEDVQRFAESRASQPRQPIEPRGEKTVRLSPIRRTIAARLLQAQQTAALLTTFNEVDMTAVKQVRADMQDDFQERYGVKLGFMSFFVRACTHALQQYPQVNAQIRDEELVFFNYCDIGIAIGAGKGLVVPVLRNAERMGFAEIELTINDYAVRAQSNKLKMDELTGGTFTISNGGVYGSMMSTPIVNPPQSAVLGMHAIEDRPVARDGQVVIRPMMYLALTYDHRIIDGKEAVTFLRTMKERIEKPALLFDF